MKKHTLSMALVLALFFSLAAPAFATESEFIIKDNVVTAYNGKGGAVVIPDGVTTIGKWSFWGWSAVSSVTFPNSLTAIEENAFPECNGLISLDIPSGVTTIGESAFAYCAHLTSVKIPSSVVSIGKYAFIDCPSLTIYGSAGSTAEKYASENNIPFVVDGDTVRPEPSLAYASTQTITIDERAVEFQMYALKDSKGNFTNYIRLRDLALYLDGTRARFDVSWLGMVMLTTNTSYMPDGSEMSTPFTGNQPYEVNGEPTKVNGAGRALDSIIIKDAQGLGYTYYKLRDLGNALDFNVGWSSEQGVYIQTDRFYQESN